MKVLLLVAIIAIVGCVGLPKAHLANPENVVRYYFESWDKDDYEGMYSTISDGFKEIEPTASNLTEFTRLVKTTRVNSVLIHQINVTSNDGERANVDFFVTYDIAGTPAPARSNLVVVYKKNDREPGWKLIQPYGNNADD